MRFFINIAIFILITLLTSCRGDKHSEKNAQQKTADGELFTCSLHQQFVPVFFGRSGNVIAQIELQNNDSLSSVSLKRVEIVLSDPQQAQWLQHATITCHTAINDTLYQSVEFGRSSLKKSKFIIKGLQKVERGKVSLTVDFSAKPDIPLESKVFLKEVRLYFRGNTMHTLTADSTFAYRPALVLRSAGEDNCHTYRIPGIITTNKGTLIAVYDNRYNNSKDLQEDIDIGMSRSTDGGKTWEPMRVIMDMGQWGGNPQRLNGTGDPCVLYDHTTHTILVAALWMSGLSERDVLWWASQPGMSPYETGQFLIVKSTDDGLSWSEPMNITSQIKDPKWQLLLAGPGRGLALDDGTLIFPAQFKQDIGVKAIDGGQYTCHSTIVYSRDGGNQWHIANGAKPNTTESQVVQLADGSLMLNMRDDLNRINKGEGNGRAVATTHDMGKSWEIHPSSNEALPEPNCMAGLIAHTVYMGSKPTQILFFSNPNSKTHRSHMTIQSSTDGGNTWPMGNRILLNEKEGFGYSCMTMVDSAIIGIVYEGVRELYFQKISIDDFKLPLTE